MTPNTNSIVFATALEREPRWITVTSRRRVRRLHDDCTSIQLMCTAFRSKIRLCREWLCFFSLAMARALRPSNVCSPGKSPIHREHTMQQLFKLGAAPMAGLCAMTLVAVATPASAGEYCRQDVTSGMRSCSFATMEECQTMSSGRGGSCYRDPFLPQVSTTSAYAYAPLHRGHRAKSAPKHRG
jgi:hypothetical protein